MKTLVLIAFILSVLVISIFIMEEQIVAKMDEKNRFKMWWRRQVIGIMEDQDI